MQGTVTLAETYAASLDQTASQVSEQRQLLIILLLLEQTLQMHLLKHHLLLLHSTYMSTNSTVNGTVIIFEEKKTIPSGHVMRAKQALQGHPESPRLWAKLVDCIIRKLKLTPCIHEPNLYYTFNYKGTTNKKVLLLRQVDDFAISCEDEKLCKEVIADIQS